jgi:hypothetical protein
MKIKIINLDEIYNLVPFLIYHLDSFTQFCIPMENGKTMHLQIRPAHVRNMTMT